MTSGFVIWITGLSGAGKTTVSNLVADKIKTDYKVNPVMIDGDTIRSVLSDRFGYSIEDRKYMASVYSRLSQEMAMQGHIVICSTISLFHEIHQWNRDNIKNYIEVYLDVPVEELKKRDSKDIYTKTDSTDYTVDIPQNQDIHIENFREVTPYQTVETIFSFLKERGYLV